MVRGFRRNVSKKIRNALDLEFFESLQHARYNYLNFLPQEYINNVKTNHSPLEVNKIAELEENYNRGWESDENLILLPKRLNKEQAILQLDGVIINNDKKFSHYLCKLYRRSICYDKTVIKWNNKLTAD